MSAIERTSEMARLIAEKDWSSTSIGPAENWPPALRMILSVIVANRFPMMLWWGPDYIQFYNDAYQPIPGTKHPKSLGQPARECWSEIWHVLQPLVDTPFKVGRPHGLKTSNLRFIVPISRKRLTSPWPTAQCRMTGLQTESAVFWQQFMRLPRR